MSGCPAVSASGTACDLRVPASYRTEKTKPMRKLLTIVVVIAALMWAIGNPAHAGDTVHGWITSAITFVQHLSSPHPPRR